MCGAQGAVQGLMRKMLLQLVAEIRKLGATVVAADFSTIIIATGKHNLTAAVGCASHHMRLVPSNGGRIPARNVLNARLLRPRFSNLISSL